MNGFEVIEIDLSLVVVTVELDSASRKWAALEVTTLAKIRRERQRKLILL